MSRPRGPRAPSLPCALGKSVSASVEWVVRRVLCPVESSGHDWVVSPLLYGVSWTQYTQVTGPKLDTYCVCVQPLILHREGAQDRPGLGSMSAQNTGCCHCCYYLGEGGQDIKVGTEVQKFRRSLSAG